MSIHRKFLEKGERLTAGPHRFTPDPYGRPSLKTASACTVTELREVSMMLNEAQCGSIISLVAICRLCTKITGNASSNLPLQACRWYFEMFKPDLNFALPPPCQKIMPHKNPCFRPPDLAFLFFFFSFLLSNPKHIYPLAKRKRKKKRG